jgi:hypothetical protein
MRRQGLPFPQKRWLHVPVLNPLAYDVSFLYAFLLLFYRSTNKNQPVMHLNLYLLRSGM